MYVKIRLTTLCFATWIETNHYMKHLTYLGIEPGLERYHMLTAQCDHWTKQLIPFVT